MRLVPLAAAAALVLGCTSVRSGADRLVFENVTVLNGRPGEVMENATVVVQDGRLTHVSNRTDHTPRGGTRIDGTGKFLIPGLVEAHAHVSKTRASALRLFVVNGVTTVRDMGGDHRELLGWRRRIRNGEWIGPRLLIAGPYLESRRNIERMRADPPEARIEPFERTRIGIGSPDEAVRVVDSIAALDVDFLKIRTIQNRDTYLAIVQRARHHGLPLVGHVFGLAPETVLEAGQSGVEHFFYPVLDSLTTGARMALWRRFAAQTVAVTPTLVTFSESVFPGADSLRAMVDDSTGTIEPRRRYLSRFLIGDWREQLLELDDERLTTFRRVYASVLRNLREMHEAGVTLLAGSDVAVLNIFPGSSLHDEMALFVGELGMTPAEAMAAATVRPAEFMGMSDSIGTIEPGNVADLVLLDADPRRDIANTKRIAGVVLRGRWFNRRALDRLREEVLAAPDLKTNDWTR